MNKQQKLDVAVLRAKMKAEETLAKHREEWHGQEPQMPKAGEVPAPVIGESDGAEN